MVRVIESFTQPSEMGAASRNIVEADGINLRFGDGTRALCATSGLWNVSFGYGNSTVARHVGKALHSLHYATLFRYSNEYALRAADLMCGKLGVEYQAVAYSTSGSSMNDAAVKFARQRAVLQGRPQKRLVLTFKGSYHGMTLSSMAMSGEALGQASFGVDTRYVRHMPLDDPLAWENFFEQFGDQVALVVLEPMLGSGVFIPKGEVIDTICRLREQHDFLLMSDEVATGFYKSGTFAMCMQWPRKPDLVGFSKALTNGTAASSMLLIHQNAWAVYEESNSPFIHGETQAGSPVNAAATIGVFDFMDQCDVETQVRRVSSSITTICENISAEYDLEHRGQALFHYLGWKDPDWWQSGEQSYRGDFNRFIIDLFRQHGIVVQPSIKGIQLIPQIITSDEEMSAIAQCIEDAFSALRHAHPWM